MVVATPIWLRGLALSGLIALQPSLTSAASIPGIPELLPAGFFSGLRIDSTQSVSATQPGPPFLSAGGTSSTPASNRTLLTSDYRATLPLSVGSISAPADTTVATAAVGGSAGFGVLRASAVTTLVGGRAEATANATVEFWDLIQLNTGDPTQTTANFDITLATEGSLEGNAGAVMELWVIDALGGPPGSFNQGVYHRSVFSEEGGELVIGSTADLRLGNRYWLYGRLTVTARSVHDFFAGPAVSRSDSVNLLNTARVFIDPGSPEQFVTSESGFDYRTPVPEPTSLALVSIGLACMTLRRRLTESHSTCA